MARQLTDLPSASTISDADRMLLRQGTISKQVPYSVIKNSTNTLIDAKIATKLSVTTTTTPNDLLDIDTLISNGIYRVTNPTSTVGVLPALTDIYVEVITTDGNNLTQTITDVLTGDVYARVRASGTFSPIVFTGDSRYIYLLGGGTLQINKNYIIGDSSTYTLPSTTGLIVGKAVINLKKLAAAATPTIAVNGGNSEKLRLYDQLDGTLKQEDTSLNYNIYAGIELIYNTNWEL
jgi:hypothetical protein